MRDDVKELWAQTRITLWPGELVLLSFRPTALSQVLRVLEAVEGGFFALVQERDEVSVTCSYDQLGQLHGVADLVAQAGPYRAITLDLAIDLGVCGYLLPAAERLASTGISIIPQCAFLKDHILVRSADAARAVDELEALVAEAREAFA